MRETIYGRNPVYECLRAGRREVFGVQIAQGARERGTLGEIVALAARARVPLRRVNRGQLDGTSGQANHQGVIAEVGGYPYADVDGMLSLAAARGEPAWLLLLDCLQDPQNLGTLLRTAEVVGVHGVVIPDRRAAQITPAVVNASSGASEHLLVAQVTNLVRTMGLLKERGVWIVGLEDVPQAQVAWTSDLRGPLGLVAGSEGQGMRRLVRETCDWMVSLPMRGRVNSLNAAVAGSVALYEAARQRARQPVRSDT
ncbi:MAG: 23S rRNA (guanosine(2251)-2'-O)-methyltransferase RlmB [Anaerolineae bacterium]|nr:23S rRNA (guanosine(2251)-2'-O)-methyltransferase RlmB [Anaerolineae bacterium]